MYQKNVLNFYYLLRKYKKILVINFLIISILSSLLAFLLPKWYYSFATIKPSEDKGVSIFSAILGAKGLSGIGKNLNVGSLQYSDLDYYKSLLLSRNIALKMVEKFDLKTTYKQKYLFKTIEELHNNTIVNIDNKSNLLIIGVYDKDPLKAKMMIEEYLKLLDSLVNYINKEQIDIELKNIENRYYQNLTELKLYEDSLKEFQNKFGLIIPEEQFVATTKIFADLKAQKLLLELDKKRIQSSFDENSPEIRNLNEQINLLNEKISQLERKSVSMDDFKFLINIGTAPDLLVQYARIYRNVEIQQKFLEYIYPLYEQVKLEVRKQHKAFVVIDKPFIPEYKAKPKRLIIILSSVFIYLIFVVVFLSLKNYINDLKKSNDEN